MSKALSPQKRSLSDAGAFASVAVIFVAMLAAAAAPSPLYVIYQAEWGFPAWALSLAFAVYAFALLATLLLAGSLSDYLGRRPVLLASLATQIVAMTLLLLAPNIETVILGRVIQGIATGASTGALSAALADLAPAANKARGAVVGSIAPILGLAIGAIATGLIVQTTNHPIQITFVGLDLIFAVSIVLVVASPETVPRRRGAARSLYPHVAVPKAARAEFKAGIFVYIAVWMTSGFFLGLIAEILRDVFHTSSGLLGGAFITILTGVGSVAVLFTRKVAPRTLLIAGTAALFAGMLLVVASTLISSIAVFALGTGIAGIGFGIGFAGGIRVAVPLAEPSERGELFASIYFVSYLAFGVPALVAGALVAPLSLETVVIGYAAVTACSAVVGFLVQTKQRHRKKLDLQTTTQR